MRHQGVVVDASSLVSGIAATATPSGASSELETHLEMSMSKATKYFMAGSYIRPLFSST